MNHQSVKGGQRREGLMSEKDGEKRYQSAGKQNKLISEIDDQDSQGRKVRDRRKGSKRKVRGAGWLSWLSV